MTDPYRKPADVIPLLTGYELRPLFPFRPWISIGVNMRLCKGEQVRAFNELAPGSQFSVEVYCPKCTFNSLVLDSSVICTGKIVRYFLFWKKVLCSERREHFHIHCIRCSFRDLMAVADVKIS